MTEAEIRCQGGITIVWRDAEGWGVEGVRSFGPNMVIFIITSGRKRWHGVRAYVPPNGLWRVHCIRQAFTCGLDGMGKLISGDLNA